MFVQYNVCCGYALVFDDEKLRFAKIQRGLEYNEDSEEDNGVTMDSNGGHN